MLKRTQSFAGIFVIVLALGCQANKQGDTGATGGAGGPSTGGDDPTGTGGDGSMGDGNGGLFEPGGDTTGTGGQGPETCNPGPDEDQDKDGFSINEGDCNDCDPNMNPAAIEVINNAPDADGNIPKAADEDCDGKVDNVMGPCDDGIALDDQDAMNGARAIDLCATATPGDKKWGVLSAKYVRADGSNGAPPKKVQYGIFDGFGPNVNVQRGHRMLALSTGHARRPEDPDACNKPSCIHNLMGNPPGGFPQDVPMCMGSSKINDDVALEVQLRSPANATGYSMSFKFYSFEYPEWVCTSYNDQYITLVSPAPTGSIDGNISFDSQSNPVSVNIAFFNVCDGCPKGTDELEGTGFGVWNDAGATDWLKSQAPIVGGDEVTIRFTIWDTGDTSFDSTTLIDNFEWIANGGTVLVGTEPIPDPK